METTVRVKVRFMDKYDHSRVYGMGEVVAFDSARAMDIVMRGLGEIIEKDETPMENTTEDTEVTEVLPLDKAPEETEATDIAPKKRKRK